MKKTAFVLFISILVSFSPSVLLAEDISVGGVVGAVAQIFAIREQGKWETRAIRAATAPRAIAVQHLAPAQAQAIRQESENRFRMGEKLREKGTPDHLVVVMNGSYSATSVGPVEVGGLATGQAAGGYGGGYGAGGYGYSGGYSSGGYGYDAQVSQALGGEAAAHQRYLEAVRRESGRR